jgi:streptogramin lyase
MGAAGVITEGKAVKGSGPFGITVAPNGDPWYTMMAANKLATLQLRYAPGLPATR